MTPDVMTLAQWPDSLARTRDLYIRRKAAKGHTYYQVVEAVRTGKDVRQRVIVELGSTSNPDKALAEMKAELARYRELRGQYPAKYRQAEKGEKMLASQIAKWDARIAKLESRIEIIADVIKSGELES